MKEPFSRLKEAMQRELSNQKALELQQREKEKIRKERRAEQIKSLHLFIASPAVRHLKEAQKLLRNSFVVASCGGEGDLSIVRAKLVWDFQSWREQQGPNAISTYRAWKEVTAFPRFENGVPSLVRFNRSSLVGINDQEAINLLEDAILDPIREYRTPRLPYDESDVVLAGRIPAYR